MLSVESLHARSNCATKLDFGQLNQFIAIAEYYREARNNNNCIVHEWIVNLLPTLCRYLFIFYITCVSYLLYLYMLSMSHREVIYIHQFSHNSWKLLTFIVILITRSQSMKFPVGAMDTKTLKLTPGYQPDHPNEDQFNLNFVFPNWSYRITDPGSPRLSPTMLGHRGSIFFFCKPSPTPPL